MKVAYSKPAKDEVYLIGKNEARHTVRSLFPDLELLAFQTMHSPKMSKEIPYMATFAWNYIRILSIRPEHASVDLRAKFATTVLPYICKVAMHDRITNYHWPQVIVAISGEIHRVTCSEGWLFPSIDEVTKSIAKQRKPICHFAIDENAMQQ
jgi:hypothetical protein